MLARFSSKSWPTHFCEEAGILLEEECGFRPQRSTTDMMFVVRRLQELGQTSNTSLEICFLDLAKTYDSVDRMLLWEVLARFGVPPRMIKVIRMFHDGMRARVQLDDGDFSAWFNVCHGFRQECVLSPLLFNIFFAAVIIVVLQRFAEDPLIVSDLVYLDGAPEGEDGRPREEGTLEMVRRAVWGMLYADDARVVSTSPRGLTRIMDVIVVACQEFGLTVSQKKTEAMHQWSNPNTATNALRIEAAGQRYKQTTEFVYLGGAISESADLDTEIKCRIGAAWASVRKYSSQSYDRRNAPLPLKIRLSKAEVMKAMLYGCATWAMRSQDFSSLRTARHKPLLRIISFRRQDRTGYKSLSYREVLERTGSERIETTIRKRQLGFAGALVRQGDSRRPKRVMFGRLAVQGPKRGGRPATSWVNCLQKNLDAFGAVPRKGKGRKWVAFGVVVKDRRDWMTAVKDGSCGTGGSRGERKHSIAPGDARTFANPTCSTSARLVNLYSNYVCDFVLFCLVAVVFMCFLPAIYRRGVYGAYSCFSFLFSLFSFLFFFRQLTPRDAPPCVCLPLSLFDLIAVPLFLLLHFISLCGALVVFLSGLSCIAYIVAFFALRVSYVVVSLVYLVFVSWLSPLNPFLAMMSFAGYFHARFLLSASFAFCLSVFVLFSDGVGSRFILV